MDESINFPEYLTLFSNHGTINVQVKFKSSDVSIANQKMSAHEISQLIAADEQGFLTTMTFDEHLYEIEKYEIFPRKNLLRITAKSSL